MNFDIFNNY